MMLHSMLRRDQKGIGAVEFALVAPALIAFVVGVTQMGKLFFANADMKNAAAAGARVASVWPIPDDATILAAVNGRLAASTASARATPTVVRGTDSNGNAYVEIRMSYTVPLEFIFFDVAPVTLTDSRRVFTQVTQANSTSYTSSGSTGASTSSTTTGGTTSATSASSAGGTSSSTSASSTSTSATSASSTSTSSTSSGDSSTSSGDSSTSSGSNGSNGNGHGHGNCNKKC